tara:strand:+ start:262 stop:615 length:354 start_codon:yes stop_codon:yes gene_type:complete
MKQQKIKPVIQFFRGVDECVLPEIRLTRSKDGKNGRAFFRFEKADALSSNKFKEIQGMFLLDEEGQLTTREVNIRISNGKYSSIEAIYSWRSETEFNRFMRFAKRYADHNDLGYKES